MCAGLEIARRFDMTPLWDPGWNPVWGRDRRQRLAGALHTIGGRAATSRSAGKHWLAGPARQHHQFSDAYADVLMSMISPAYCTTGRR